MNTGRSSAGAAGGAQPLAYQPALDGIRALAALAVVVFHLRLPVLAGGARGVDMFFTLSGFLITSILIRQMSTKGRISFRSFYARRALRLLPAYFAVVIAVVIAYLLIVDVGGTRRGVISSFLYIANWYASEGIGLGTLGHTWSLSVEEQFYFLWPVLLLLVFRLTSGRIGRVLLVVGAIWLVVWGATIVVVVASSPTFNLLYYATPFRATELLAGCLLAVAAANGYLQPLTDRPRLASAVGLIAMAGLLILLNIGAAPNGALLISTWAGVSVLTAMLIASLQTRTPTVLGKVLSVKPLVAIGLVSYGLYLWHFPVMVSIDTLVGLDSAPARLISLAITAVLVVGSYFLIERPFLRLKGKLGRKKSPATVSAAVSVPAGDGAVAPDAA